MEIKGVKLPYVHYLVEGMLPDASLEGIAVMLKDKKVLVLPAGSRRSKSGDFCLGTKGMAHRITLNRNLNPYAACITLVHEIAHLYAFEAYGRKIKPHGTEWKQAFRTLMFSMPMEHIFPADILKVLVPHMQNPKASSHSDLQLISALRRYDQHSHHLHVEDLEEGVLFTLDRNRWFRKGNKRRTRYLCFDVQRKKHYLVHALAQVLEVESGDGKEG